MMNKKIYLIMVENHFTHSTTVQRACSNAAKCHEALTWIIKDFCHKEPADFDGYSNFYKKMKETHHWKFSSDPLVVIHVQWVYVNQ